MNQKTQKGFNKWMVAREVAEKQANQTVGYVRDHVAVALKTNIDVLTDTGDPVANLGDLIAELERAHENWDQLRVEGAEASVKQYKVGLGKYIQFAKSLLNGDGVGELTQVAAFSAEVTPSQNTANDGDGKILAHNRIVFGAPGTGKSHLLEVERKMEKDGARLFPDANYERVTFYATYSYSQFVGTYKPVMKGAGENEKIAYQFVPGPFLRMLVKALNRPQEKFLLIIEEINRANAAAVFGDVFQLLDRGADGVSEYSIAASEDAKKYLEKALTEDGKQTLNTVAGSADMLKIPANLYLWATMNSADQGVFPLDTAFKRRWSFEYVGINESADACDTWKVPVKDKPYNWNAVRSLINALLSLNGVNEDKLMGPFFVKAESADVVSAKQFESKVLMYLWEDAARMCRGKLFGSIKTYFKLIEQWRENGPQIFKELMKEGSAVKRDVDANKAWGKLFPSMAASNA